MRVTEEEGRTIEEAVANVLKKLGLRREHVKVEVLSEGRGGLFGLFGGRRARVRVIPEEEALGKARAVLEAILERMRFHGGVTPSWRDHRILLEVRSPDGGLLIGQGGRTLEALQHLVNRILDSGRGRIEKVVVDVEGYRRRREEELTTFALRLAAQAKATREPVTMTPLSSHDRRIVHLVLQGDQGVKTTSEGTGFYRRVIISPSTSRESEGEATPS